MLTGEAAIDDLGPSTLEPHGIAEGNLCPQDLLLSRAILLRT